MRRARQVIATFIFTISTIYICGLSGLLPEWLDAKFFVNIQLVPALLSASVATLIGLTALVFLLGRFYCSAICPLGIAQDLIMRSSKWIQKKRKIKAPRAKYRQAHNILRYGLLAATTLVLILGSSYLLILLDPYSIFGRISAVVLNPIINLINNSIAHFTNAAGNYTLTNQAYQWSNIAAIATTIITFGTIIYLNIKHKRLWCNSICPVGTLLGLFSRFAIFKIHIDLNTCTNCKACAKSCKSDTIDYLNNYKIDYSRCVSCYNCIDACKFEALQLSSTRKHLKK